jgi:uncharacterized protein YaiE (UPF0345 family)
MLNAEDSRAPESIGTSRYAAMQRRWKIDDGIGASVPMTQFMNVTINKKANVYFDGKVTSRTVLFPDGTKKTLGVMLPGDYEFNTAEKEIMEITSGELEVMLPGASDWRRVRGGEAFEVPANAKFRMRVSSVTDYCCSFVK